MIRKVLHAVHLVKRNRNVIVSDCHLYDNRGAGIFYDHVNLHQSNITGCHISYNGAGGIVCRGGDVRNIQVAVCDIEANMDPNGPPTANVLIDCSGGAAGIAEVAVSGCTLQHSNVPGAANIRFVGADAKDRRWGHFTITGNVLSDVAWNIDLQKARGVTIVGNTFWMGFAGDLRAEDCCISWRAPTSSTATRPTTTGAAGRPRGACVPQLLRLLAHRLAPQRRAWHGGPGARELPPLPRGRLHDPRLRGRRRVWDRVSDSRLGGCLIRNDLPACRAGRRSRSEVDGTT